MRLEDQTLTNFCNSARMAGEVAKQFEEKLRAEHEHRATLEAGAKASVEQRKLLEQQVDLLKTQNSQLTDNYNKLKEMYDRQVREAEEAKKDLKKSWRFNVWMMVIAVISMLAAVAGPVMSLLGID